MRGDGSKEDKKKEIWSEKNIGIWKQMVFKSLIFLLIQNPSNLEELKNLLNRRILDGFENFSNYFNDAIIFKGLYYLVH